MLRALWDEPPVPAPPGIPWWDRALGAVLVPAALVEGLVRDDVPWPAYSIALAMVCPVALLWRTRHPLAMLVVSYGAQTLAGVGPALAGEPYGVLVVTSCVLLCAYSLARWASGRAVVAGVTFLLAAHLLREPLYGSSATSILVGVGFLLFPVALGAAVRFAVHARRRESEQARMRERTQLARELHDTVAHAVSGILVQAQAGRVVAATDPGRAVDVLHTVEQEAARSLAEMRSLVAVLRDGADAERAPTASIGGLERLTRTSAGVPVELSLSGDVDGIETQVGATVYRVVQEALTNARQHAEGASAVRVEVAAADDVVRVDVVDDGTAAANRRPRRQGFGLVSMTERVELLGGSLQAGPAPQGGWSVSAVLPRTGT